MRRSGLLYFDNYIYTKLYSITDLIIDLLNGILAYMSIYTVTYYLKSNITHSAIDYIESQYTIATHNYKKLNVYICINRMTYTEGY